MKHKIWASGVYVACILIFLTLNMSRSFQVIRCTFLKKGGITQKWFIIERNRWKFGFRGLCCMRMCTFNLEHVKVIFELWPKPWDSEGLFLLKSHSFISKLFTVNLCLSRDILVLIFSYNGKVVTTLYVTQPAVSIQVFQCLLIRILPAAVYQPFVAFVRSQRKAEIGTAVYYI